MWFDCAAVPDSPPRHLAPRRQGRDVRSRRWLFAGGLAVVLAAGVAVAVVVTRDGSGSIVSGLPDTFPTTPPPTVPPVASLPPTTAARTTTTTAATTTRPPTTTSPPPPSAPAQPVRSIPGNLLANGDFERDLAEWGPSGGGRVDRVAVGHSGGWSARIRAGGAGSQPASGEAGQPGLLGAQSVRGRDGRSYEASAWVRASRPGIEAVLRLRESGGGGDSADVIGVTLTDAGWQEVAVIHQVQTGGRLTVEVTAGNLRAEEYLLVDQIGLTAS
jgi:hypothetical protein